MKLGQLQKIREGKNQGIYESQLNLRLINIKKSLNLCYNNRGFFVKIIKMRISSNRTKQLNFKQSERTNKYKVNKQGCLNIFIFILAIFAAFMTTANLNNETLLYQFDQEDAEKQNTENLSTTSNSQDTKIPKHSNQAHQIYAVQILPNPSILKVKPIKQLELFQEPNKKYQYDQSTIKINETITFRDQHFHKQEDQSMQEDLESPAKLKKPRRKRLNSPIKRRKQLQEIIVDENSQFTDRIPQRFQNQQQLQKLQANNNWQELQDTERQFGKEKKQQNFQISSQFNDRNKNLNAKKQIKQQQFDFRKPQSQILIDDNSRDSEPFQDEDTEIYQDENFCDENNIMIGSGPYYQTTQQNKINILKELQKQVLVETTIEYLVMDPIKQGLKMVCYFEIQSKYFGMSKQYNMVLKQTGRTVLSAKKQHFAFTGSKFIISMNKDFISKRKANQYWSGRLQGNFYGTSYELTKRKLHNNEKNNVKSSFENQFQKQTNENYDEQLNAVIQFEENLWGSSGIRKMQIKKLDFSKLTRKDILKQANLEQILERNQVSKLIKIKTKKPTYNKATKRYSLDFEKKVKMVSSKNIILQWTAKNKIPKTDMQNYIKSTNLSPKLQKITDDGQTCLRSQKERTMNGQQQKQNSLAKCLLIAKQSQTRYLVQVSYPLSIFEAFGACLANNDTKLLVN